MKLKSRSLLTLSSLFLANGAVGCDLANDGGEDGMNAGTGAGTAGDGDSGATTQMGNDDAVDGTTGDDAGEDYGDYGADYGGVEPADDGEPESCCAPSDLPGCVDPELEACVCAADPVCCGEEDGVWDAVCVDGAVQCGGC